MHNIKLIKKDADNFLKKLSHRNANIDIKKILNLDEKNRELIQNKEKLEQEKKNYFKKKRHKQVFTIKRNNTRN